MKSEELESAVAKAVNHRSEYQQPLLKRLDQMVNRYDHMEAEVLRLREALAECEEYFDNRADADQPAGSTPIPNDEMRMLVMVRGALNGDAP